MSFVFTSSPSQAPKSLQLPQLVLRPSDLGPGGFRGQLSMSFVFTSSPSQAPTTLQLPQLVSGPSDLWPGGFRGRLVDWNTRHNSPFPRWLSMSFVFTSSPSQAPTTLQPPQLVSEPSDFGPGGFWSQLIDWDTRRNSPLTC
ncbi:hypothetical protein BDN72DRAFT_907006 [Pluteus cervinus]|uniref:Uncharacterized protein n=1 Tax=Pluteus cervinus TaxID=181527 RepID=A0ACD2ZXP5_9AGAR|nr:hypothetical protein BDN72DRAFT_907006 [Pluteus cervinus]